jgi:hypothetical protein
MRGIHVCSFWVGICRDYAVYYRALETDDGE